MPAANLDKDPRAVAAMFDEVAARYDITNAVLALGLDRYWRRVVVDALGVQPGQRLLDLAAGTGTSSRPFARAGVRTVACDFSLGMLRQGRRRGPRGPEAEPLQFVAGDAVRLPFADGAFDAATISFGLRNVVDVAAALRELARVTRPGGRLVVCEFSRPTARWWRTVYAGYLLRALPVIARRVSSSPDSYLYLADSIRAWPDQLALAGLLQQAGWRGVEYRNLVGGVVAVHRAQRP